MTSDGLVKVLNALPTSKLIDTVSSGLGKAFEPRHIKKMADARAYEINTIGEALRSNSDVIVVYEKGSVVAKSPEFEEFVKRTEQRLAYQELQKQYNIESVVDNAYSELQRETEVSDQPVEQDWINRFFNCVEDISDQNMQILWGKILAGEIKIPGTYSKRTLDVTRNLSQYEAQLFQRIAPYIIKCCGDKSKTFDDYFFLSSLLGNEEIIDKTHINFPKILDLSSAGLITSDSFITIGFTINPNETETFYGTQQSIKLSNSGTNQSKIVADAFLLTPAGKELLSTVLSISQDKTYEGYMTDCWNLISKGSTNTKDLTVEFCTV